MLLAIGSSASNSNFALLRINGGGAGSQKLPVCNCLQEYVGSAQKTSFLQKSAFCSMGVPGADRLSIVLRLLLSSSRIQKPESEFLNPPALL